MKVVLKNPSAGSPVPPPPEREGGGRYRFELIYDGGRYRAYADTAVELLDLLIPGYEQLGERERRHARIQYALQARSLLQAHLLAELGEQNATAEEAAVLRASADTPPKIARWKCRTPLVLVDAYYQPQGALAPPQDAAAEDDEEAGGLFWMRTEDELALLASLLDAGFIELGECRPESSS